MTRADFIAAVSAKRGAPDQVQSHNGGVSLHYGNAVIAANDCEIRLNNGADFDRMVSVRLAHARGWA